MQKEIEARFTYHNVMENQIEAMKQGRQMAKELAVFMNNACKSRETSLALVKLEEAVMHFNAGIARNGTIEKV